MIFISTFPISSSFPSLYFNKDTYIPSILNTKIPYLTLYIQFYLTVSSLESIILIPSLYFISIFTLINPLLSLSPSCHYTTLAKVSNYKWQNLETFLSGIWQPPYTLKIFHFSSRVINLLSAIYSSFYVRR